MKHTYSTFSSSYTPSQEHRLLFEGPAEAPVLTPPASAETPVVESAKAELIAKAVEKNRSIKSHTERLADFKKIVAAELTTAGKLQVVDAIINIDNSADTITFAHEVVHAEMEQANAAMKELNQKMQTDVAGVTTDTHTQLLTLSRGVQEMHNLQLKIYEKEKERLQEENTSSLTKKIGNKFESLTNVLPDTVTSKMSRNEKIAISAAVTGAGALIALYGIYRWFKKDTPTNSADENKNNASKKSWLNKWTIGGSVALIGIGAFFGIKHFKELKQELENVKNLAKNGVDTAVNASKSAVQSVTEFITGDKPWEEFGISEAEYEEAVDVYTENTAQSKTRLEQIFNVAPNGTSPQLTAFTKEMATKFQIYEDPTSKVLYTSYEKAKTDTELTMRSVVQHFEDWIQNNETISATVGILGYKYGLIKGALAVGTTITSKTSALGAVLLKFGVKSPITSLLIAGSATSTVFAARAQLKGTMTPTSFTDLLSAASKKQPIFLDASTKVPIHNATVDMLTSVTEHTVVVANSLAEYGMNLGTLIAEEGKVLIEKLGTAAYENTSTTKEVEIFYQNQKSFDNVRSVLRNKQEEIRQENIQNNPKNELIRNAEMALIEYETVFFSERNEQAFTSTENSIQALARLQAVFAELGLQVAIQNDIVTVTDKDEVTNLSIDPAINDINIAMQLSETINSEAHFIENLPDAVLRTIRLQQEDNKTGNTGETLGMDGIPGMLIGNTLYALNPYNYYEYATYTIDTASEIYTAIQGENSTKEIANNVGKVAGVGTMLTLSTAVMTKIGSILKPQYVRTVPASMQSKLATNILKAAIISPVKPFSMLLELGKHYRHLGTIMDAKINNGAVLSVLRMNSIMHAAGVNPNWVRMIESGDKGLIKKVIQEMKVSASDAINKALKDNNFTALQETLKAEFVKRIDEVKQIRFFSRTDIKEGDTYYDQLKQLFTGKTAENVATDTSKAAVVADDSIEASRALNAANKVDEVDNVSDATDVNKAADEVAKINNAKELQTSLEGLVDSPEFKKYIEVTGETRDAVLQKLSAVENLNAEAITKVTKSKGAQRIFIGALQSGDATEISRAVRMANEAGPLAKAFGAAGFIVDGYALAMCAYDYADMQEKKIQTNNPTLRAIYSSAQTIIVADGATNLVGIAIGGIAMYKAVGTGVSVLSALSSAGGLVMLPIGLAMAGGRIIHRQLVESAEYHLATHEDLVKETPGKLLADIHATSSGRLNWGQSFADWVHWDSNTNYAPDEANAMSRFDRYRAYFAQIAFRAVPPVSVFDLDTEVLTKSPEVIQQALKNKQSEKYSLFTHQAIGYICHATNKSYDNIDPNLLESAQIFAMQRLSEGINTNATDRVDWTAENVKIETEKNKDMETISSFIHALDRTTDAAKSECAFHIMNQIRHDLTVCDQRIIEYTEDSTEQANARRYVALAIQYEFDAMYSEENITINTVKALISNLKRITHTEPNILLERAKPHISSGEINSNNLQVVYGGLGIEHIIESIQGNIQAIQGAKETKESIEKLRPLERSEAIQAIGNDFLIRTEGVEVVYNSIGSMNPFPDSYKMDLSIWSKGIYLKCIQGKWKWSVDNSTWSDTAQRIDPDKSWSSADDVGKMNYVLQKLHEINSEKIDT